MILNVNAAPSEGSSMQDQPDVHGATTAKRPVATTEAVAREADREAERILIVDDSSVSTKLVELLLTHEGYTVQSASDAEIALQLLKAFRPDLVLIDLRLPGMSGLELTRLIKSDKAIMDTAVIVLTASTQDDDKKSALEAGCDGYITKPIDARSFPGQIRSALASRAQRAHQTLDLASLGLAGPEFDLLRGEFLRQGLAQCQVLLNGSHGEFNVELVSHHTHQWAGNGALLGYPEISALSKEIEDAIREKKHVSTWLREALTNLALLFAHPNSKIAPVAEKSIPQHIHSAVSGKRIAVVGFPSDEAERLCQTLDWVKARPRVFELNEKPWDAVVQECDLVAIHVSRKSRETGWISPAPGGTQMPPTIFVGDRDQLLMLDTAVSGNASGCVMGRWQPDELLFRFSLALSQRQTQREPQGTAQEQPQGEVLTLPKRSSDVKILIADDDPIIEKIVSTTVQNHGMKCLAVRTGEDAIRMIRQEQPSAAVLDVDMPGKSGFEVLTDIRNEKLPVAVVLLTCLHREQDITRGFKLGADDYIIKPFNPLELVARLRRLLR